jgi:hypothetical protein
MTFVVRAAGDPAGLSNQIRSAMAQTTPYIALAQMRTFDEVVANSTRTSGMLSWLSVLFGVLAAVLAILGIYSVMSYTSRNASASWRSVRPWARAGRHSSRWSYAKDDAERRRNRRRRGDRVRIVEPAAKPAL